MTEISRNEVLAKAKEVFGEGVDVGYSNGTWSIYFDAEEKFDASEWAGTPAYEYFEVQKHSVEDWANGYGCYWESHAQIFDNFNGWYVGQMKQNFNLVKRMIDMGKEFDGESDKKWRDDIMEYAEKQGWK